MKIITKGVWQWDGSKYVPIHIDAQEYSGPVALCCGPSTQQTQTYNEQSALSQQVMQQGQQVFGNSLSVFNDLESSLSPIVAAGPNQTGFSAAETSALNSSVINNNGIAYKNAKAATGDAIAGQNGGNNSSTSSGTTAGVDANLAASASENTANQLNQVVQQNYATGRQNYDTAVGDLTGAPGVFNPVTGMNSNSISATGNQATTANNIASQNNSWIQGVTGALGGVASAATTAGLGKPPTK